MRRAVVLALAPTLGFTLFGGVTGTALGLLAPGFYRRVLSVAGNEPFEAVQVGLGFGVMLGFLAGVVVVAAGLIARLLPGLSRPRSFARRSFQPTFAGLMFAVVVVALGFASLKNPSPAVAKLWFSLTALALAWATLVTMTRSSGRRGFAVGFAVLGWSYLLLSLSPESRAQLPTSDLLAALERRFSVSWGMGVQLLSLEMGPFRAVKRGVNWEPVVTNLGGIPGRLQIEEIQPEFRVIGHSLFALLVGLVGGIICDLRLNDRRSDHQRLTSPVRKAPDIGSNPLKQSAIVRPPGPVWRYLVHFCPNVRLPRRDHG